MQIKLAIKYSKTLFMYFKKILFCSALLAGNFLTVNAQTFIPPNLDFEAGTTANWNLYKGTVSSGHIYSMTSTGPIFGLHLITSMPGMDAYGLFPVVGFGIHSLKIAHDTSNNNADAAEYNIAIPASGSYSLIYHYAAVLQDAMHTLAQTPAFEVTAVDSASGTAIMPPIMEYPSSPGFSLATTGTNVYYKSWSTGSVDFSGHGGQTIKVRFTVGGCATAGHFGYGYLDASGVFETASRMPCDATTATLTAPTGYATYIWTDSATFTSSLGTTAAVTIPAPGVPTTYAVIMRPNSFSAFDTFYTRVSPTSHPTAITGTTTVLASHTTTLADAVTGGTWSSSNTAVATVGSGTGVVTGVAAGTATITYSLGGTCEVYTTVTVASSLAVSSLSNSGTMSIYPSPAAGDIMIRWNNQPTGTAVLEVLDISGRSISKTDLNFAEPSGEKQISLGKQANGTYIITIKGANINYSNRVVIQQ